MDARKRVRHRKEQNGGVWARMFPERGLPLGVFKRIVHCVRPAGVLLLAAIAGYCLWLSWFKWLNPQVDFSVEIYMSWRALEGDLFGRDIFFNFGPMSTYWNAMWMGIFGVSLNTIVYVNLAIYAVIVFLAFRLLRVAFGYFPALVASACGIFIFGFGDYNGWGNYNYMAPYAHAATHGILILLILMTFAARQNSDSKWSGWGEGLIFGFLGQTKLEIVLAGSIVLLMVGLRWVYVHGWAKALRLTGRVFAAWAGVMLVAWLWMFFLYWAKSHATWVAANPEFVTRCYLFRPLEWLAGVTDWGWLMTLTNLAYAAAETAWAVFMPLRSNVTTNPFQELTLGVSNWQDHLWLHVKIFSIGTAAIAALAVAARLWIGKLPSRVRGFTSRHAVMMCVCVLVAVGGTKLAQLLFGIEGAGLMVGAAWTWEEMLSVWLGILCGGLSLLFLWKWTGWEKWVPERMLFKRMTLHPAMWGIPLLAGGYTLASQFVIWTGIARMFWGTSFVLAGVLVARFLRERRARGDGYVSRRLLAQTVLLAGAVTMLARMVFFTRMYHYGFYQAMLAGLVTFAFIFKIASAGAGRRHAARVTVAIALIGLFSVGIGKMVGLSAFYYRNKGTLIGKGADSFYCVNPAQNPTGQALWMATEYVRSRLKPEDTVLMVPEGVWVNYMLRLKSPLRYQVLLMPLVLPEYAMREAITTLEKKPPTYVILAPRVNMQEYGVPYWGYNEASGKSMLEWIVANYVEMGRVEDKSQAGSLTRFRMIIYKRKEAAR